MTQQQQLELYVKTMDEPLLKVTLDAMKNLQKKQEQQKGDIAQMFLFSASQVIGDNGVSDITKATILKYACMLELLLVENNELKIAQSN